MMNDYLLLLSASPMLAFALHFCFAKLVAIFKGRIAPLAVALSAVLFGYGVMGFFTWKVTLHSMRSDSSLIITCIYGFLVYTGLAFSYFQCFGMTETARRIRILRDLHEHGTFSRVEFQKRYGADNILNVRLERLVSWKQLKIQNGRYVLASHKFYWIAKMIEIWAKVLGFS